MSSNSYMIILNNATTRRSGGQRSWYTVSTGSVEISYSAGKEMNAVDLYDYCEQESVRQNKSFLTDIIYSGYSYDRATKALSSADVYTDSYPENDIAIVKYALIDECAIEPDGDIDYGSIKDILAKIELV